MILVIWNDNPEHLKVYSLDPKDFTSVDFDRISKCHGQMIGMGDADEEVLWLREILEKKTPIVHDEQGWSAHLENFTGEVILTGQML